MGGVLRANMLSEQLGMNQSVKRFLKFLFEKCGNCPFRIVCWSQLFPDKGELIMAYRKAFLCDGTYKDNAKESFDGKQSVKFLTHCAIHDAEGKPCQYLEHCICKILDSDEFLGMVEATSDDVKDHVRVMIQCANCKDNVKCWSGTLKGLGFGWTKSPKIIKIMMGCKFTKKDCLNCLHRNTSTNFCDKTHLPIRIGKACSEYQDIEWDETEDEGDA